MTGRPVEAPQEWIFTGTSDGLITSSRVASPQDSGAEARFPRNFSASIALRRFVQTAREGAEPLPVLTIEVLGQAVTFRFDNEANMLSISTAHSPALPAHAMENSLGEPCIAPRTLTLGVRWSNQSPK